ncbi:hypothetical protein HPB52_024140 [Rhipicephalus sanguineus]|uniref:Uncharacterized protein n=1 Tax=Rhipicephalus sanguineus TaxID=34632 RepID=A0A9D4QCJ3_RHISA|nr:hypothetical protein HPB52_024140 [Rhipicephalus sanguineus]
MHPMYPETYPTDKCKVCRRETADHAHPVGLHQTPRGSEIKNYPVAARGSREELRPAPTALGRPAGPRCAPKAGTQRAGNGQRRRAPSNGNPEDDLGPRRGARAPNCRQK